MTKYRILLADQPREYIDALDEKSKRIVRNNLEKLESDPYPGSGKGDKRWETVDGEELCRLHIGRTHTAFYTIHDDSQEVRVVELWDIDTAHKRYD